MTIEELLVLISEGLAKPLTKESILSNQIQLNHLKRIDKVFKKGLHYYLDPKSPEVSKDASIFFRKNQFGTELSIGAKKVVHQFEEFKIALSGIAKLADIQTERTIPVFNSKQDPKQIAKQLRPILYPGFQQNLKDFLKAFIGKLAENNILVFEFVETWNKKERANIDGFFLAPNVIVLKRQQSSFRREIYTLAHELAHYLLNEEEIEELDLLNLASHKLSSIEKWCNEFAYYFLVGEYDRLIENIEMADATNDYHQSIIADISSYTHVSQIALYTRLLYQEKLTKINYNKIKADADEKYKRRKEEEQKQKELEKARGIKQRGAVPQPIHSPLLIATIQTAFYEGVLNELDVCKALNISPDKLDRFIQ